MQDQPADSSAGPSQPIPVSPNNPCPFLRGLVANGYVGGHTVPLPQLTRTIEVATGKKGLTKWIAGGKIYVVALFANSLLNPLRVFRNWWSGPDLDELRNGPLDKHGAGSRILSIDGRVNESEVERLASFGSDYADPDGGGTERGLNAKQVTAFMDANFERAKGNRWPWYPLMMKAEFPVLLDIMGKGEGDERYLSVAEVRTLFVDRLFPQRIVMRLKQQPVPPPGRVATFTRRAIGVIVLPLALLAIAITQFPDRLRAILITAPAELSTLAQQASQLGQLLPPPLPDVPPVKTERWLDQNWSLEQRHWFHHVSQGTKTFPVPYAWFVALEQPRIHLLSWPGMLSDSNYLERFGFIPSPKSIDTDKATLLRYGYTDSPNAPTGKWKVENTDGLPVGFARLVGATDPATGVAQPDLIGLTCAACHTGSIRYKGTSIRYDGGPAMVNLLNLEKATGLSIAYTLIVPFRFDRFANRVLGANATEAQRAELKKGLTEAGAFVKAQADTLQNLWARVHQEDTEEGYGRLDALNRIGNQVFYTDLVASGIAASDNNMHVRDAPVSFPPIWNVPWFLYAQYDASIQQPLIRNAGEALGVSALVNLSPDTAPDSHFRSSVAIENLEAMEKMIAGPNPFTQTPRGFAGLKSPTWPSAMFPDDDAWKIKPTRVEHGRQIYAEICVECHLGPVNDPVFDAQYPDKRFWNDPHWKKDGDGMVLEEVQKGVGGIGTDPGQAHILMLRTVEVPAFLDFQPARDLGQVWGCPNMPAPSSAMSYALALMIAVDRTARKWMDDSNLSSAARTVIWGTRKNCPNAGSALEARYRARPLNGVWGTAPYLHNGSVPSLYWMLTPAAERPKQFCMGTRDFDPEQVGFRVEPEAKKPTCRHGETLFSTTNSDGSPIPGNSNLGHSLEGTPGPGKPGVIGRLLDKKERYDLIEYLKTL